MIHATRVYSVEFGEGPGLESLWPALSGHLRRLIGWMEALPPKG